MPVRILCLAMAALCLLLNPSGWTWAAWLGLALALPWLLERVERRAMRRSDAEVKEVLALRRARLELEEELRRAKSGY